MGRRAFLDDLATAKVLEFENFSDLTSGEDGEFSFAFSPLSLARRPVRITAMILDLSTYPKSHDFLLFASDDAPHSVPWALEHRPSIHGLDIPEVLSTLSKHLTDTIDRQTVPAGPSSSSSQRRPIPRVPGRRYAVPRSLGGPSSSQSASAAAPSSSQRARVQPSRTPEPGSGFDDEDIYDDNDDSMWRFNDSQHEQSDAAQHVRGGPLDPVRVEQLREDLRAADEHGFRVGVNGDHKSASPIYVSVSCHVSKLGLSDEALQSWALKPSDYLVLLIYYHDGYRRVNPGGNPFAASASNRKKMSFRVAISRRYKAVSADDARSFFNGETCPDLHDPFISRPLNALFNERFLAILHARCSFGLSWTGAEHFFEDLQGSSQQAMVPDNRHMVGDDSVREGFLGKMTRDTLPTADKTKPLAIPLLAGQFLIRHFVGCTWFCLVCHCKIRERFEAVKPYVCEKPLCLYQYMELGLGPSIDHEVKTQPLVVDLLISFCYAGALYHGIREYPKLNWLVPDPNDFCRQCNPPDLSSKLLRPPPRGALALGAWQPKNSQIHPDRDIVGVRATLDLSHMHLTAHDRNAFSSLKVGDWMVVRRDTQLLWHCRVIEVSSASSAVKLSKTPLIAWEHAARKRSCPTGLAETIGSQDRLEVVVSFYNTRFDLLSDEQKAYTLCTLLNALPKVGEMRRYLMQSSGHSLDKWHDRLSPAHKGLLRWIIASNRSCILQVDEVRQLSDQNADLLQLSVRKGEERIGGLNDWLQFRFAMGSPDKEARFCDSLKYGNPQFPSLFAWHGSPFKNWHSIIRHGLNYETRMHGRAYGDGVYLSNLWQTSMSYSGGVAHSRSRYPDELSFSTWPQSLLEVTSAIALVEVVNAPEQFRSSNPHYVVQHVDWIQTRYLFARPADYVRVKPAPDTAGTRFLPQDSQREPVGPMGGVIRLPNSIIPKGRRINNAAEVIVISDSDDSDATTRDDMEILGHSKSKGKRKVSNASSSYRQSKTTRQNAAPAQTTRQAVPPEPLAPFSPGPIPGLPVMPSPTYATRQASASLQRAYRALVATQEEHMRHNKMWELGWYVDVEHVNHTENIYHWVVCLHSFPMSLPLAQDMVQAGVQSVVLEMRFPHTFPFSPPFVRVIRPRFLPFLHGGGGHVTAGGSICMDLLTSSGWNPAMNIESVLLSIRMAMMSTDPRPARLENTVRGGMSTLRLGRFHSSSISSSGVVNSEYGVQEAVHAFIRACQTHGWTVPVELNQMTS